MIRRFSETLQQEAPGHLVSHNRRLYSRRLGGSKGRARGGYSACRLSRGIEQVHLFDYFGELAAPPCQRQPQGRMCNRQATATSRRRAFQVGFSHYQLSRRILQPSLGELGCRVSQSQLRMLSQRPGRERLKTRSRASRNAGLRT